MRFESAGNSDSLFISAPRGLLPSCISAFSRVDHSRLVFRRSTHWKLKAHTPPRQLSVDLPIGVKPIIHTALLLLIKNNLQHLTPVLLRPDPLAHNLDRVHHIGQDRVVHGGQGARAGSFLGLRCAAAVGAFGTWEDAAGGEDEDMAVGEFLLELAGEPLLNLVEAREEGDRNEDYDGFLAVADFDLDGGGDSVSSG